MNQRLDTKSRFFSNRAQALTEILMSVAIASIVGLGVASFAAYGVDQFNVLVDQNLAEKSLVQSAYYLRNFLSQAVTTSCAGVAPAYAPVGGVLAAATTPPVGIAQGQVDCRNTGAVAWAAGVYNPIAIFNRENGSSQGSVTGIPVSSFQGVGIYFTPPLGTTSGVLTFAQSTAAGTTVVAGGAGSLSFDRLVDIQVLPGSVSENTGVVPLNLKSLSYTVTARYFTTQSQGGLLYDVSTAPNVPLPAFAFRDITMDVTVGLHDNYLGINATGSNYTERLDGGIYFFKFTSPEFNGL